MKITTKIGLCAITIGFVISLIGFTICSMTGFSIMKNFGEPLSYETVIDEKITELDIDVAFSNIEIKKGSEFKIVAEDIPEKLQLAINTKDGKLKIENKSDFSGFKLKNNIPINFDTNSIGKYIIYISDENLDKINIDVSFSSLTLSDINFDKAYIECSFGEYIFKDIDLNKINFESSFSDISIDNIECENAVFTNSFGNFEAQELKITEVGSFENSFGEFDVSLTGKNYDISVDNSMGSFNNDILSSSKDVKISVDNSFGETNLRN